MTETERLGVLQLALCQEKILPSTPFEKRTVPELKITIQINNNTTVTEDITDRLPQIGMYIYLIAEFMALVVGASLIILGKDKNRNQEIITEIMRLIS